LLLNRISELRAFFHVILDVIEYLGPVITLIDDLMGEGVAFRMIPTIAIMDFLHHFKFVWFEAPHVRVSMKLGVRFLV